MIFHQYNEFSYNTYSNKLTPITHSRVTSQPESRAKHT